MVHWPEHVAPESRKMAARSFSQDQKVQVGVCDRVVAVVSISQCTKERFRTEMAGQTPLRWAGPQASPRGKFCVPVLELIISYATESWHYQVEQASRASALSLAEFLPSPPLRARLVHARQLDRMRSFNLGLAVLAIGLSVTPALANYECPAVSRRVPTACTTR